MAEKKHFSIATPEPDNEPPPPYEAIASNSALTKSGIHSTDDGRVDVDTNSRLFKTLSRFVPDWTAPVSDIDDDQSLKSAEPKPHLGGRLNIVIQVVGSRGDVQPFVALGNELQRDGHRVRLATHNTFRDFVKESGLEFYPIGGDPTELMAYMVKNPGLIPSMKSLRAGDVQKKRKMVSEILIGCWNSCIDADPDSKVPFVANAIIANPPSFAHVHCAQALSIPLQLMFTMPWSSTRMFPHPLANLKQLSDDPGSANFVSYSIVEWMTWQGLGDIINEWRVSIDLEPVPLTEGPGLAESLKVPFTYCWSPSLVPKPLDWPDHIDVCGFFFRDAPRYTPPQDLHDFLRSGPPPVYIGFGSIVLENPAETTRIIIDAVKASGVRAIISRGWSKLGGGEFEMLDNVMFLGDCPHEWLFQYVSAVVHHGGAGTTACGLRNGKPTTVVPFFGDQPFWGDMIARAGAGPKPIPFKSLTAENLTDAIQFCLTEDAERSAQSIAYNMSRENGVQTAVRSFYRHLPQPDLFCDIIPDQPAVWQYRRKNKTLKISGLAAEILVDHVKIDPKKLELHSANEIVIENRRWDPVTGTISAMLGTFSGMTESAVNIVAKPIQILHTENSASKSKETMAIPTESTDSDIHMSTELDDPKRGKQNNLAVDMMAASASGVGGFFKHYSKGIFIDVPLAFAEGSRTLPRLYGEEVTDYGTVKDWKSGFLVSGKNLTLGIGEGFVDLVKKPYEGGKKDGFIGGIAGVGKGILGLTTKVSTAALGTVAYPGLGIYKSIRQAVRGQTRKAIYAARREEGVYLATHQGKIKMEESLVLERFNALLGNY